MSISGSRTDLRRGLALPLVLILGAVLFLMSGTVLYAVTQATRSQRAAVDAVGAYWLARSGVELALSELARNPNWAVADPVRVAVPLEQGSASFSVSVTRTQVDFQDLWLVSAVGTRNSTTRRLVAAIRPDTFSRYAFLTHRETTELGHTIWFTQDDEIQGPVFTNHRFHLYNNPRFHGSLRSVSPFYWHYASGRMEPVYTGKQARLAPAPLTAGGFSGDQASEETLATPAGRDAAMAGLLNRAREGGLVVDWEGGTRYDLELENTTLKIRKVRPQPSGEVHAIQIDTLPTRVVYVEGEASVRGTLDGRLTIASSGNLIISDSIHYRFRQVSGAPQDDMLGLVSRRDVVLDAGVPHNTTVDASILALGDSFYFQGNGYNGNPALPRGTLTVYGGIAQVRRGVMGMFRGRQTLAGFAKDYRYDARLRSQSPPYFPRLQVNGRPRLVVVAVRDLQSLGSEK